MNKKINYGMIFSVVFAVMLLAGAGFYVSTTSDLKNTIQDKDGVISDKDNALLVKDTEISNLANEVTTLSQKVVDATELVTDAVVDTVVDVVESIGYLIDGLFIGDSIDEELTKELTDRELNLFDGEVEFDDEKYNADEYLNISGIKSVVNKDDYNEDVYTEVLKGNIVYRFDIEDTLNTNLISRNNTLVFDFLGEKIKIVKWNDLTKEITFKKATEIIVNEGDTVVVDGNTVLLDMVMDGSVLVTVNGESEKIYEGGIEKVGGIEVYVSDVLYTAKNSRISMAILAIGNDVEETVENNTQYKDSVWNWIINNETNTIGLTLAENFNSDLDKEDEDDYKPLGYGDKICLPNDYVCIEFVGLSDEEYREYEFDYDYDDNETVITGEFEVGNDDVDKITIKWYNNNGTNVTLMYYDIGDDEHNTTDEENIISLKDSDMNITCDEQGIITIGEERIVMPMNLSKISFDDDNETDEGTYRSIYGSIIEIKDDLVNDDDKELSILIPEEQVELSFLVY